LSKRCSAKKVVKTERRRDALRGPVGATGKKEGGVDGGKGVRFKNTDTVRFQRKKKKTSKVSGESTTTHLIECKPQKHMKKGLSKWRGNQKIPRSR